MSDVSVSVDVHGVNLMFEQLSMSNREARKAVQQGYRASGNIIKKQAQANMRAATPNIKKWAPYVNVTVYRDSQGLRVDALGVYTSGKGMSADQKRHDAKYTSYKMRFFNWGASSRKTRKGYNRGSIAATSFMHDAIVAKKDEAVASLSENIFKFINRVVSRRK